MMTLRREVPREEPPALRAMPMRNGYICINCDTLIHVADMVHGKSGSQCPACASKQVYPIGNIFPGGKA